MTWSCWSSSKCIINNCKHGWLWKAKACSYCLLGDNHSLTKLSLYIAALVCLLVCHIVYWCWYQTIKLSYCFTSQHCSYEHDIQLTFYWALFSLTRVWLAGLNASWQTGLLGAVTPLLFFSFNSAVYVGVAFVLPVQIWCKSMSPTCPGCGPLQMIPHITKDSFENMAR